MIPIKRDVPLEEGIAEKVDRIKAKTKRKNGKRSGYVV
jgi:hypothetical protein